MKFSPQISGKIQYETYATVKETIAMHVQKSYKNGLDIAKAIKDMKHVDMTAQEPTRRISAKPKTEDAAIEQAGLDIKYQEELRRHLDRVDGYKENCAKAYSLIFKDYCTKTMQQRIEGHPDFSSKIEDDPIALLEALKSLTHSTVRAQYPLRVMTEDLARLLNRRQTPEESTDEYIKAMKQHCDVVKGNLGDSFLVHFVRATEEYKNADSATQTELTTKSFEQWCAYMILRNCDQARYGTLVQSKIADYAGGDDKYPKTILRVTDMLIQHKLDPKHFENQRKQRDRARQERQQQREDDQSTQTSFAQRREATCYCCGRTGHTVPYCPDKDKIPRSEWHVNKAMSHMQNEQTDNDDTNDDDASNGSDDNQSVQSTRSASSRNRRSGTTRTSHNQCRSRGRTSWFNGFMMYETSELKDRELVYKQSSKRLTGLEDKILLDSGSTIGGTFMNPDLLTDIRESDNPIQMSTNAGSKILDTEGTFEGFGDVWIDPTQIANILGFSHVKTKHRITYDSAVEDAFNVHTDAGIVKFKGTDEGLYAYEPGPRYRKSVAKANKRSPRRKSSNTKMNHMVSTVKENRLGYTQREFDNAKRARKLYHILGCPSTQNYKHIIRQKIIKNCPVTIEDINIAEKIFGPDIATLKGKTTRQKPPIVREDLVEIPPEIKLQIKDLVYSMDIMFVNNLPVLTGIDGRIRYRSSVKLRNRTADELYSALDEIFRFYNHAGFFIRMIHCDNEFRKIMDAVKDELNCTMNYAPAQEHVPEAERNIRTIAERIRAIFHQLPYNKLPKVMLQYLTLICTRQLNYFPAKGGVSNYYSPHVIMTGRDLDYSKHCQIPFGAYVQASQDEHPKNNNKARTIDAIYLQPMTNKQGGHEVMDLNTGRPITRPVVWEVPVTDRVIKAVETMAENEGFKTLKLLKKNKVPIFPADWTAGVDYDDVENQIDDIDDDSYVETEPETESESDDDESFDDEQSYEPIDRDEIEELLAEPGQRNNDQPAVDDDAEQEPQPDPVQPEENNPVETVTDDDTETAEPAPSRPTRTRTEPSRLTYTTMHQAKQRTVKFEDEEWFQKELNHNLFTQHINSDPDKHIEYDPSVAMVIARVMSEINGKATAQGVSFAQQYILQKGLKKFGNRGKAAAAKELDQLHKRCCFTPISFADEKDPNKRKAMERKAMEALMFLTEKRDGTIKGRMVYNGKPTREWLSREDSASPTAALESIMLTAIVDAKEGRDVMTADVPNAFIQTSMPEPKEGEDPVTMKITGVLVDLLVEMAPEVYGPFVVFENGRKVLYVQVLKALYGMLVASLLWYKQFKGDLEKVGFKFNPYDPCVANKTIEGKQMTVRFHVDDLMSSHMDPAVNDEFLIWLNKKYGGYGEVKATRGHVHDYLGMTFDFSEPGKVKVDMIDYMCAMVDDFSTKFKPTDTAPNPAAEDLFALGNGPKLEKEQAEEFHTFVAKGLFACKRARPDIHTAITALCTHVKSPNQDDWKKLHRLLRYINGTRQDKLILSADDLHVIKWYVDAAFAVHPDFKSHTGGGMTYGTGMPQTMARKQKLNTRSSTEAELVGADDMATMILWTKLFMEAQGYEIKKNILYQDNKSTILLENNGKRSSSKRTRAINIRYFFLTDQIEKGNLTVDYCPTTEMIADYFSKPLQGKQFEKFRKMIMGH